MSKVFWKMLSAKQLGAFNNPSDIIVPDTEQVPQKKCLWSLHWLMQIWWCPNWCCQLLTVQWLHPSWDPCHRSVTDYSRSQVSTRLELGSFTLRAAILSKNFQLHGMNVPPISHLKRNQRIIYLYRNHSILHCFLNGLPVFLCLFG